MKNRILLLLFFGVITFSGVFSDDHARTIETFTPPTKEQSPLDRWKEKAFAMPTKYEIIRENDNYVLHAVADSAASGLYKKVKYELTDWPYLSWRWKVTKLPAVSDVHQKELDDYGARVYVIFPRFLKWKTRTISYIWAKNLPKGESIPNAWLPQNAVMIAVESGSDSLGRWIEERRNVYKDYKQIFHEEPPRGGAIAIMTDTDNTGGMAEAFYDDFKLLKN